MRCTAKDVDDEPDDDERRGRRWWRRYGCGVVVNAKNHGGDRDGSGDSFCDGVDDDYRKAQAMIGSGTGGG
eukprot:1556352-Pyramimonas_sp.AAC.1